MHKVQGDIQAFLDNAVRAEGRREDCLFAVLEVLMKPGNEQHLANWDRLISIRNKAQLLYLETEALRELSNDEDPKKQMQARHVLNGIRAAKGPGQQTPSRKPPKEDAPPPPPPETNGESKERSEMAAMLKSIADRMGGNECQDPDDND